ncbi:MAG: GNAT family N-acetyltransferase, partial [Ilumatobacteraceae bacterium]
MAHPIWPLFDLRVRTPRLELRYIDDELAVELSLLAAKGIHDPDFMPFNEPWSLEPSPVLERRTMQFYWRCRAELTPAAWNINFATIVGGDVVGTSGLFAHDFPMLHQFETGSWLGCAHQGKGIGKEMRVATLQLGFLGLGAEFATTGAFEDNGPSLGVTGSLGYAPRGQRRIVRQQQPALMQHFEMTRADFLARLHRDDITLHGVDDCLPLLGLDAS